MEDRDQLQFLESALGEVKTLDEKKETCEREQQQFQNTEKELEALKKKAEKEKETRVRSNRTDVESEYDRQLRKTEAEISRAQSRRQNARNTAEKDRIKMETAGLRAANESLKGNISRILKERNLPWYCGTRVFLYMFNPRGVGELLKMILTFLVALVLLPLLITLLIKEPGLKYFVFGVIDVVVIGAYIILYQKVATPGREGINLCHDEMDKIRDNEKEIRRIERSIKKDKDDSRYNLVEHDTELTRLNQQKNEIIMNKQAALTEFDTQTADKIRAEVDKTYAPKIGELSQELAQHGEAVKRLSAEIVVTEQVINSRYTQYLGAKNVTEKALEQKIEEVRTLQAQQMTAAAAVEAGNTPQLEGSETPALTDHAGEIPAEGKEEQL